MIDPKKQYRTRDGREVRIYAVDKDEPYGVHGAIKYKDGWNVEQWSTSGAFADWKPSDERDLIEVKPRIKRKVWLNVYSGRELGWMTIHDERGEADDYPDCHNTRIACVEIDIDVEEGHGL